MPRDSARFAKSMWPIRDNEFEGLYKLNQPIRPSLANEMQLAIDFLATVGPDRRSRHSAGDRLS